MSSKNHLLRNRCRQRITISTSTTPRQPVVAVRGCLERWVVVSTHKPVYLHLPNFSKIYSSGQILAMTPKCFVQYLSINLPGPIQVFKISKTLLRASFVDLNLVVFVCKCCDQRCGLHILSPCCRGWNPWSWWKYCNSFLIFDDVFPLVSDWKSQ